MFNLIDLLQQKGHEVVPFSVRYKQNQHTEYDKYFVSPLSSEDEVYFRQQSWNLRSVSKTLERAIYSKEVYSHLVRLIENERPDFAIVLHYLRKLSPSVIRALHEYEVPFIVRLSDFAMICPNAHLLRDGAICELCIKGSLLNSVRYKCVQNLFSASAANYLATRYHLLKGYFDKIKLFMVPSKFTISKMVEAGYDPKRFVHIPTFVSEYSPVEKSKKMQIAYVGRVERIKGIHVLLESINLLKKQNITNFTCTVVGGGSSEYMSLLRSYLKTNMVDNVVFTGEAEKQSVYKIVRESLFTVAPSICYENMPNSVIESLACGTPVIASAHGSFPEIVLDGRTGFLFKPGDAADLAQKMIQLMENLKLNGQMSSQAVAFVRQNHSPEKHYESLMQAFSKLTAMRSNGMENAP